MFRNAGRDPTWILLLLFIFVVAPALTGGLFRYHDIHTVVAILLSFIIATSIHEFMHAYTAWRLGDDTAARLGRITLNPAAHFEPFGFIGMVLLALGFGAFGWGKPVPVNPSAFRGRLRRRQLGMALVAVAGPVSNIVQAGVVAAALRLAEHNGTDLGNLGFYLAWFVRVNVLLASFNLIPVPPLDGYNILVGLLPNFWYPVLAPIAQYGFIILFALIFIGGRFSGSIVSAMIDPPFNLLWTHVVGGDHFVHYLLLYR